MDLELLYLSDELIKHASVHRDDSTCISAQPWVRRNVYMLTHAERLAKIICMQNYT